MELLVEWKTYNEYSNYKKYCDYKKDKIFFLKIQKHIKLSYLFDIAFDSPYVININPVSRWLSTAMSVMIKNYYAMTAKDITVTQTELTVLLL